MISHQTPSSTSTTSIITRPTTSRPTNFTRTATKITHAAVETKPGAVSAGMLTACSACTKPKAITTSYAYTPNMINTSAPEPPSEDVLLADLRNSRSNQCALICAGMNFHFQSVTVTYCQ